MNHKSTPKVGQVNDVTSTEFSKSKFLTTKQKQSKIDTAVSNPNLENSQSTQVEQSPDRKSSIAKPVGVKTI